VSLVRYLPAWLHAIADYAVGFSLVIVAIVADVPGKVMVPGIVVGLVVLAVSAATKYPLGVVKVLPFTIHSAGDYLAATLLVVAPFALGFSSSHTAMAVFYVSAGLAVLAVSLVTNYQYGPAAQAAMTRTTSASAPGAPAPAAGR
jgi:hypothetical protein